jgi:hypothetical protein
MYEKIKEVLQEYISKIPQSNQLAMNSFDWMMKCHEIGKKYNLTDEEIYSLNTEIGIALVGVSDFDTLFNYIENEIGGTGWEKLRDDIIENIIERMGWIVELIEKYDIYNQTLFYFEDIYTLDLPLLLKNSTLSGTRDIPNSNLTMKYYDCKLDTTFLNAFDTLRIGFCWEEKEIKIDPQTLDLTLFQKNKTLSAKQVAFVVDSIVKSCTTNAENELDYATDARMVKTGIGSFMLLDHPNGHDIGISHSGGVEVSVNINIGYEDFLKFRKKHFSF